MTTSDIERDDKFLGNLDEQGSTDSVTLDQIRSLGVLFPDEHYFFLK